MTINANSNVQILAEETHPLDRFDPQVHVLAYYPTCTSVKTILLK